MTNRPGRTLGVSLAILASLLLFTILPLIQVAMVVIVQARLNAVPDIVSAERDDLNAPLASGGEFLGQDPNALVAQTALALGFAVVAALAWAGRRPRVRVLFIAAVLLLTAISMLRSLAVLLMTPALAGGLDSGQALAQQTAACGLIWQAAIPLYVLWYMNRAPARAFYQRSPQG